MKRAPWVDYATYLALERESERKHEWLEGQLLPWGEDAVGRAGGTVAHGELAAAMAGARAAVRELCKRYGLRSADGEPEE